ncbi:hypothetical protein HanPI659440_Chr04g0183241 [Helianthus annuus]|nr:hypothetical protein HanPI659440_Chr04g0183241 [Helianthus annuus]
MNTFIIFFLLLLCLFLLKSGDITRAQENNYATEEEKEVKGFDENTLFSPYTKQQWRSYQHKKINEGRKTRLKFMITYPNKTAVRGAKLYIKQLT